MSSLSTNINTFGSDIAIARYKITMIIGFLCVLCLIPFLFKKDNKTEFATGTITKQACAQTHNSFQLFYSCNFNYEFVVDGKLYKGFASKNNLKFPGLNEETIEIRYNPNNPNENTLKNSMSLNDIAKYMIIFILLMISMLFMIAKTVKSVKGLGGLYVLSYF
jgi:hypothetical protein